MIIHRRGRHPQIIEDLLRDEILLEEPEEGSSELEQSYLDMERENLAPIVTISSSEQESTS